MKFTIDLGKVDYNGTGRHNNRVTLDVELEWTCCPFDEDGHPFKYTIDLESALEWHNLSICGNVWNSRGTDILCGGQCYETISELFPDNEFVQEVVAVWARWHLNDLKAGTRRQAQLLDDFEAANPDWRSQIPSIAQYEFQCYILEQASLLIDNGYKYGSAWLVELLPQEVIDQVLSWQ